MADLAAFDHSDREHLAALVEDPTYRLLLMRFEVTRLASTAAFDEVLTRREGADFLTRFLSSPEWMEDFLVSGPFDTLYEATVLIKRWRVQYNTVRLHCLLGYRPPAPEAWFVEEPNSTTLHQALQLQEYTHWTNISLVLTVGAGHLQRIYAASLNPADVAFSLAGLDDPFVFGPLSFRFSLLQGHDLVVKVQSKFYKVVTYSTIVSGTSLVLVPVRVGLEPGPRVLDHLRDVGALRGPAQLVLDLRRVGVQGGGAGPRGPTSAGIGWPVTLRPASMICITVVPVPVPVPGPRL